MLSRSKLWFSCCKRSGILTYLLFCRDCLTSTTWSGAISQVRHAIQHHSINKMIVLGSASIFDHTSEYLFWQHEMAFILAIFELGRMALDTNHYHKKTSADDT
jgi:hypothetical protein